MVCVGGFPGGDGGGQYLPGRLSAGPPAEAPGGRGGHGEDKGDLDDGRCEPGHGDAAADLTLTGACTGWPGFFTPTRWCFWEFPRISVTDSQQ